MSTVTPAAPATSPARRDLIRAWVSLGLMVPGAVGLIGVRRIGPGPDAPVLASVLAPAVGFILAAVALGYAVYGGLAP